MADKKLNHKLNLPSLSLKKGRDVIGIELDENHLRMVYFQLKGLRREFIGVVVQAVRGLAEDNILLLIRQAIEQFKVDQPQVFLTVPLPLVITRNIEIPSQDPREIKEIVNLQASRHTPYARAEIIVDLMNLGVVREKYAKILLVIVPKDTINQQIQLVERSGLKIDKVIFPPEAVAAVVAKMAGSEVDKGPIAMLHMDHSFASVIISENTKILFVRVIHIGVNQLIEERPNYIDRFYEELEKSFESYGSDEVGTMPKTLLLSGAVEQLTDFDEDLAETLHLKVRRAPYIDYFHFTESAKKSALSNKRISMLNLLAPAAMFERLKVDLTSEEKKLKIQLQRRAKDMLKTGVLTMVFFSLIFAHVTATISFKRAYLKKIINQYLPVRDGAKQLEQKLSKTELIKSYLVSRGNSLTALTQVYDVIPDDIWVTEIKYDETAQKFSIKGTAAAMSSVFRFVSDLEKSSTFMNVKTKYVNNRSDSGRDVADFEINCLIEGANAK